MPVFCTAAAAIGLALCPTQEAHSELESTFMSHMAEHGLSYATPEEFAFRFKIFAETDAELKMINARKENTFTVGHNFFSTMTQTEKEKWYGLKYDNETNVEPTVLPEDNILGAVDWRSKMNPIKNQGGCGSCWAFASIQVVEGHHAIKTGQKVDLSEQMLVDCVYDRSGCQGGATGPAQNWIMAHGVRTTANYPYKHAYSGKCLATNGNYKVTAFHRVPSNNVAQMKAAVQQGPVAVCVGVDTILSHYTGGIVNDSNCLTKVNHGVGVVGFGSNFWIVRNSWGATWGEQGYARIAIVEGGGICAIQTIVNWSETN